MRKTLIAAAGLATAAVAGDRLAKAYLSGTIFLPVVWLIGEDNFGKLIMRLERATA
jgi:hypothetical protein